MLLVTYPHEHHASTTRPRNTFETRSLRTPPTPRGGFAFFAFGTPRRIPKRRPNTSLLPPRRQEAPSDNVFLMEEITFTDHALYQMAWRNIDRDAVSDVLSAPDRVTRHGESRQRAVKRFSSHGIDRLLVVAYEYQDNRAIVITAFYTSKIHKYLS